MGLCGLHLSGAGLVQVESSCECGNEPSVSIKCWGNYRMAIQLVGSGVVLRYRELVS
jgi:hypothetical protein